MWAGVCVWSYEWAGETGVYEFPVCWCKHYLVCVHVCEFECVNPCQTYLLAVLVRGACGWGGAQSALVGRPGIKTDYSKAAQWLHSLSSEYGHCLCMGANWSEVECAGLYWSGLVWSPSLWDTLAWFSRLYFGQIWFNLLCFRPRLSRVCAKIITSASIVVEVFLMGIF